MTTYLYVWVVTALAFSSSGKVHNQNKYWQNFGTFHNIYACQKAGQNLGLKPEEFRCITMHGETK